MDHNGESDTRSMNLDPVSPGSSSTSRDLLDEPAAPRRNSTDDNDTSRPRKRPAVMMNSETHRENAMPSSPTICVSDTTPNSDTIIDTVPEPLDSKKNVLPEVDPGAEVNKTLHIRASQSQADMEAAEDVEKIDLTKDSSSLPSRSSDADSDSHTMHSNSPEVEVEEIEEMDVNEGLSYHIQQMDPNTGSPDSNGDFDDTRDLIAACIDAFDRNPCPLLELRELSLAISQLISPPINDSDQFELLYLRNSELFEGAPILMDTLLRRTLQFEPMFFYMDKNMNGLRRITKFISDFTRLAAVLIQYEALKLTKLPSDEEMQLCSERYLFTILSMLKPSPLYEVIAAAGFAILEGFPSIFRTFSGPDGFLDAFTLLSEIVFRRVPERPRLATLVEHLQMVALTILKILNNVQREPNKTANWIETEGKLVSQLTIFVEILYKSILDLLDSHTQTVDIKELLNRLEHLGNLAAYAHAFQPNNPILLSKLGNCIINPLWKTREIFTLVDLAFKFPFYYKMLCSSRMDVRLRGLNCMTDNLVKAWRSHSSRNWQDAPLLRFLVDYLIRNNVCQYIVGPESHSELIHRSGNVPSFLLVNNRITEDILESLWQPIVNNRDPRISKATLNMHREMLTTMDLPHLLSLSQRIGHLPFSYFDSTLMNFIGTLCENIRGKHELRQREERGILRLAPEPYEMLIGLLRRASGPNENTTMFEIFDKANSELAAIAEIGPEGTIRRQILGTCMEDIIETNGSASGSIAVIYSFLGRRPRNVRASSPTASEDIDYLTETFGLPSLVVRELSAFVESNRNLEPSSRMRQLRTRLDLVWLMLRVSPNCLTKELHAQLWSYLVGDKALGPSERDQGLQFYNSFYGLGEETNFLFDCVFHDFFPALDAKYFPPSTLVLCMNSLNYLNRVSPSSESSQDSDDISIVEIAGVEQLWRIILDSCDETLAVEAIAYFVKLYLDSEMITRKAEEVVEKTHLGIIERCINQLTSSAQRVLSRTSIENGIDEAYEEWDQITRNYHRCLDLLTEFVKVFRQHPMYIYRNHVDSAEVKGEKMTLVLRLATGGPAPTVVRIQMGTEDTAQDLLDKIHGIIVAKYRIISSGRELMLADEPSKPLHEFGIRDTCPLYVYIQREEGEHILAKHVVDPIQPEIMRHFAALYKLLDLPEQLSVKAWYFLHNFTPNNLIKEQILDKEVSTLDILPSNKPYKCLYSLFSMRQYFEEQRMATGDLMPFMHTCISRLLSALTSATAEYHDAIETQIVVIKEILECLYVVLRDPISDEHTVNIFPEPDRYVACVFGILRKCTDPQYNHLDGAEGCITNAMYVLFLSSSISPQVWLQASKGPDLHLLVQWFLVEDSRHMVRECMCKVITTICTEVPRSKDSTTLNFAEYFWPMLLDILSTNCAVLKPVKSEQLFRAAIATFDYLGNSKSEMFDLQDLFDGWFRQLQSHSVNEVIGKPQEDHVLGGYSRLLRSCISFLRRQEVSPSIEHLEESWTKFLFPMTVRRKQIEERIPALHDDTRTELYRLILDLVSNRQEGMDLIVRLNHNLYRPDYILFGAYWAERDRWLRAPTGLVGLHNLSNTCYLNSLLTQLFMNRTFRDFILGLSVIRPVDSNGGSAYQLQALFARMQASFHKGVEPRELVDSLRDFAGDPIDPTVQMDVDEFFNLLFDRLESEMPSPQSKALFRSHFGGQLVQQVKSNECEHVSERTEPFSAIQCDIKGKYTLQESLKAYVEGEIMDGDNKYRCTSCDRLVDAVKRTCLKDIPDHLICHLKRFDFDLQTMHRSKINDRFEFPTTLDMKPYTIDHLSAKESGVDADMGADEFELVGVLVHTGTAESGHYYSYIRDRLSPAGAPYWYEYNDSEVSPFDPSTIPENCYGGGEPGSATGYMLPKSYSAYMLFYQRSSSLSKLFDGGPNQPNEVPLPLRLHQEILHDNEELLKRYCMFGSNYVDFVKELLDEQSRIPRPDINGCSHELEVLRLGLQTFEQICSKVKEFSGLEGLSMSIERFAVRNQECCRYFLEWLSDDNIISSMVICAPFPAIRATVCKMMINALGCMAGLNTTLYGRHDPDYDGVPITREQTMLFMVCKGVSNSWMGLRMTAKSWNDFFTVLVEICSWGTCEQEYMLKAGILRKVLEMVLIDHLPTPRRAEQSTEQLIKLMSKPKVPVAKMTELLCLLMSRCTPFIKPVKNEAIRDRCSRGTAIMPLTILENDFLRHNPDQASAGLVVYTKLLECIGTVIPLGVMTANILKARCAPDEDFFIYCIKQTLLNGVPVDPASHAAPSLHCLVSFVSATKSQGYIDDIIKKVAEEVPTIGMSGGAEHLQFFRNLCKLDATDRSIKRPVIESIQLWAPALLVYHEAEVREATEDFTDWLFIEEEVSEPIRKKALGELADGCFKFITTKFPQNHQPVDEHTFESLLRILENCKLIDSKLEELKGLIQRMILEDDDASDEWGGSDIGSDVREGITTGDDCR